MQERLVEIGDHGLGRLGTLPPPLKRWESFLPQQTPDVTSDTEITALSTPEYLAHMHKCIVDVVSSPDYLDAETGYISDSAWQRLVKGGFLASSLGDRDPNMRQEEIMHVGRMASYYDISLGLSYGITTALVIMPIARFGTLEQQEEYLTRIRNGERFGLAITERDRSGSSALDMDSSYSLNGDEIKLKMYKHLQGLSGNAGLIVTALRKNAPTKTVGLFLVPQEHISTERIPTAGLNGICYGINTGEITLSKNHLMVELQRRGLIDDFRDLFTKSRAFFVGMSLGQQEREEELAKEYAQKRIIGGKLQAEIAGVQWVLNNVHARTVILETLFNAVVEYRDSDGKALTDRSITGFISESGILKTLSSWLAHESARDRAELKGGKAFYAGDALQDVIDTWAFTIFEGSRLFLYDQIGGDVAARLKNGKLENELFFFDRAKTRFNRRARFVVASIQRDIDRKTLPEGSEFILGEIFSYIFALGLIDEDRYSAKEAHNATDYINDQIEKKGADYRRFKTAN
ncbi:acyl-CoA/acyl-ACP dehydrogenase [Candidatus Shapirobacteria bacterium]|nr:acyl-CoA/acyl-ACP dehydrogenase [Candidatus Shapirobacteria bacterium]